MDTATYEGGYLPSGEFLWRQPIRAYEPSSAGRLGLGNLLRYCEIVANAASAAAGFGALWYQQHGEGWVIYRQTIELAAPIGISEEIDLMTWVRSYTRVTAQRDYLLRRARDGAAVARATTTWAYVERERQSPRRIPPEIVTRLPNVERAALHDRPAWGRSPMMPLPVAELTLRARTYEADTLKHVNNCVYADWLTEAAAQAQARWGDAVDPLLAKVASQSLLPRRLTIHYQRSARPGDDIIITTVPTRVGSRGLTLSHTVALRSDTSAPLVTATADYLISAR
jgi:acyl-CoA thioesterase FadM